MTPRAIVVALFMLVVALRVSATAGGRPPTSVSLPPSPGTIVTVSTEPGLQAAVRSLASHTTIVLTPGTYHLTRTLWIQGTLTDVGIRGATANRDDVVLQGPGMTTAAPNLRFGVWSGGNVQGVTIANLTIRDIVEHPIVFNAGTQRPHVYNVHLIDAGQQFIKSNPDGSGSGVNDGIIEYSVIEYTTTAKSYYTNGIDVHTGANWIIRHNLLRNIVAPAGQLAGPAVLMWNHSRGTITEGNTFLNCARGIAYGLEEKADGPDHRGGIIRNNYFYRSAVQPGDVGISVADSPNSEVVNNTVIVSGTYGAPIEYRFPRSAGVLIANNLTDGTILAREGASAILRNNVTRATSAMFANAAAGDLHLVASASMAIDRGVKLDHVSEDWDGRPRPYGPAWDIGADEYDAGPVRPQPWWSTYIEWAKDELTWTRAYLASLYER